MTTEKNTSLSPSANGPSDLDLNNFVFHLFVDKPTNTFIGLHTLLNIGRSNGDARPPSQFFFFIFINFQKEKKKTKVIGWYWLLQVALGTPHLGAISFIFLQFSAATLTNNKPQTQGLVLLSRIGNPESATV